MRALILLCSALLCGAAQAIDTGDAAPPTQQQLKQMLLGNTLEGEWAGRPFTQHFADNGTTRYREGDGETTHGTWRVIESGQYCSIWPPFPRETCYEVLVKDNRIWWKFGDNIYPSMVSPGDSF